MSKKKILQIMPCNKKMYSIFKQEDGTNIKRPVLGFALVEGRKDEEGLMLIETFSADNVYTDLDCDHANFEGYEYDIEGYSNKEQCMTEGYSNPLKKKILELVIEYVNKHTDIWSIKEAVHQNDKAMEDAIELFSKIISIFPPMGKDKDE